MRPIPRTGDAADDLHRRGRQGVLRGDGDASCTTVIANAVDCPARSPSAASTSATSITATTATLKRIRPRQRRGPTTVSFDYGTSCTYPSNAAASPANIAAGVGNTAVTAYITGLACNTSYYFRTKAVSAGGTTTGNDAMFTTATCGTPTPVASTGPATAITQTTAVLTGVVGDNGADTTVSFDVGFSNCYGFNIPATPGSISSGTGNTPVSAALVGLTCNTRYHFRVLATNTAGTTTASDRAFTTAACP